LLRLCPQGQKGHSRKPTKQRPAEQLFHGWFPQVFCGEATIRFWPYQSGICGAALQISF
jgi:hypothetical protein